MSNFIRQASTLKCSNITFLQLRTDQYFHNLCFKFVFLLYAKGTVSSYRRNPPQIIHDNLINSSSLVNRLPSRCSTVTDSWLSTLCSTLSVFNSLVGMYVYYRLAHCWTPLSQVPNEKLSCYNMLIFIYRSKRPTFFPSSEFQSLYVVLCHIEM